MTPEYINAWKNFPKYQNTLIETAALIVVYDKETAYRLGNEHDLSAKTFFVDPGYHYSREFRDFNRDITFVVVLDDEDKAFLENPKDHFTPWDWISFNQHRIYNKYFSNMKRQLAAGDEYSNIEQELDVVIWGSPIWTVKNKDRRMPQNGTSYFRVHVPEEVIEGVDDEHTVNLLDQAQAITHNRLSALREKIPAFKRLRDEEQLAILTVLRDKDVDDFAKIANDRNEFINADVRRLREAMTEFGITV